MEAFTNLETETLWGIFDCPWPEPNSTSMFFFLYQSYNGLTNRSKKILTNKWKSLHLFVFQTGAVTSSSKTWCVLLGTCTILQDIAYLETAHLSPFLNICPIRLMMKLELQFDKQSKGRPQTKSTVTSESNSRQYKEVPQKQETHSDPSSPRWSCCCCCWCVWLRPMPKCLSAASGPKSCGHTTWTATGVSAWPTVSTTNSYVHIDITITIMIITLKVVLSGDWKNILVHCIFLLINVINHIFMSAEDPPKKMY